VAVTAAAWKACTKDWLVPGTLPWARCPAGKQKPRITRGFSVAPDVLSSAVVDLLVEHPLADGEAKAGTEIKR
jgi:hypothetical protein